jgi:uncharacterized protein YqeY
MIHDKIDKMIMEAMKAKEEERVYVYRLIKAKFLEYKTSKGASEFTDAIETTLLNKMIAQREQSIMMYEQAGRNDMAEAERAEVAIISEFVPKAATEEDINKAIDELIAGGIEPIKKNMGMLIKGVKAKFQNVDGKLTSELVSKRLQ